VNMMLAALVLPLLFTLSARQELFLVQKLCPGCTTIGVLTAKGENQDRVGELEKASIYYNFTIEKEMPKKTAEIPEAFANLLKKNISILIIYEDSLTGDPNTMRFIISQALEKKFPVICGSEKQLAFGATFFFAKKPDGSVYVKVKKAALEALKLTLPPPEEIPIEIVE
jgi:ABC-type uncharacterized transport system substrate-binding protein